MPLITDISDHHLPRPQGTTDPPSITTKLLRKQSTHSEVARSVLMNNTIPPYRLDGHTHSTDNQQSPRQLPVRPPPPQSQSPRIHSNGNGPSRAPGGTLDGHDASDLKLPPSAASVQIHHALATNGVGRALSDTPMPTAPSSPRIPPIRQNSISSHSVSGCSTPRIRPTTLDIPGLTKSKVSPDGRIAQRDLGAKLLIVMVGLPARGKSYITKKMARYLNWLQHETHIFNVGERRRVAAGGGGTHNPEPSPGLEKRPQDSVRRESINTAAPQGAIDQKQLLDPPQLAAKIFVNGEAVTQPETPKNPPEPTKEEKDRKFLEAAFPELTKASTPEQLPDPEKMDQTAHFFDPQNRRAALIREQCAMETLDEAIEYLVDGSGTVAIMDATNSTLERRAAIMRRVHDRCGNELNVLFVESLCKDERLLESNMRLKLSGPDYKDKDPISSLEDFKKRVAIYEKAYVPLGDYEERNNMAYVQMVDVGRKVISHQIKGFIAAQAVYYLLNFNLAPRMIWITRHGESMDNVAGKIGGDSDLSPNGHRYARAVTRFINHEREIWEHRQREKTQNSHFPPLPGDMSPPNPYFLSEEEVPLKNFCVWTSMLKRAIQTAQYFDEEEFDLKQMRMLDELNAGFMEGMTYEEIRDKYADEFALRKQNKLQYRYPGPGGEGYLDIINRIRPVIVELERMTDHALLVTHRSVARVLLAYFLGLDRNEVADIDCPLGLLYMLEPKPYGVEFKAYQYNPASDWFDYLPDYKPRPAPEDSH
ncbi:6-phosphofructo-2-kinase 1 [Botryosphaeria dothidea]|uniref:6-phosphofructo-2-kinase 1 n=1 Tax=Botryosphaeria dothidea TaxID=55169 RepID=A0A8H4J6F0_9PEZI|nr:6-phosphofructo-2-kinase 1 [Botryosphaeria dothidea]